MGSLLGGDGNLGQFSYRRENEMKARDAMEYSRAHKLVLNEVKMCLRDFAFSVLYPC